MKPEYGIEQQHHSSQRGPSFSLVFLSLDQSALTAQQSHTLQQQHECARQPYSQL